MFVVCGVLSLIPITHMELFTDAKYLHSFETEPWAVGGALYIIGACFYMTKVPERCKAGMFDFFVNILNIWLIYFI